MPTSRPSRTARRCGFRSIRFESDARGIRNDSSGTGWPSEGMPGLSRGEQAVPILRSESPVCQVRSTLFDNPSPFCGHDERAPPSVSIGATRLSGPWRLIRSSIPVRRARQACLSDFSIPSPADGGIPARHHSPEGLHAASVGITVTPKKSLA
jgi:hypothetical protein